MSVVAEVSQTEVDIRSSAVYYSDPRVDRNIRIVGHILNRSSSIPHDVQGAERKK